MNRSFSAERMAPKSPRTRPFFGEDRAKYPVYIQVVLGMLVLGFIFGLPTLASALSETDSIDPNSPRPRLRGSTTAGLVNEYYVKIIADLDQQSLVEGATKPTWHSTLLDVSIHIDPASQKWSASFGTERELTTNHNEAGRGMELSELVMFNNALYSMDDRTGIVFEISKDYKAVPRHIVMEGDGNAIKGQKIEWATVKDGEMYVGSIGKEYTLADGTIASLGGLWVARINKYGTVKYIDWTDNFGNLRKTTGTSHPGYMIHEAITWSPYMRKWVVLPRRVSTEPYDEVLDESRGSNYIILANEDFSQIEYRRIGTVTPVRGFSSFKFVPGSQDQIIVALKSEERADTGHQTSYITVFSLDGTVLLEETEVPGARKYEGLEFVDSV